MPLPGKSLLSRYVPSVSANPFELALRLLTSSNPAARSAVLMAMSGVALAPLDAVLARRERAVYANAAPPVLPIILVCGPPRSGTTLVAQFLINRLDVAYVNNLASLFPKAPVVANALFGFPERAARNGYNAFYGRSKGLAGVNDALFVWDRWLGADRGEIPSDLALETREALPSFFGAWQERTGKPIVNKVNRLFSCASLVAPLLPSATFVCLRRDPLMLAQSLLIARDQITGDRTIPYGVRHDDPIKDNPLEDVCRQVEFYDRQIDQQLRTLGPERFIVLAYEQFCESPQALVDTLLQRSKGDLDQRCPNRTPGSVDGQDGGHVDGQVGERTSFEVSRSRRLPAHEFDRLRHRLQATCGPGE